jgi:hypothetical protein
MRTEMDYLVMGGFLLAKDEQTPPAADSDWKKEFTLD